MRSPSRWRQAALRSGGVVVVGGVAALGALPFLPPWGAAAVAAAGGTVAGLYTKRAEQRMSLLDRAHGIPVAPVDRIDDLVPYGVHPAQRVEGSAPVGRMPQFVEREAWQKLLARLEPGKLILIKGESTAGKSRMAIEAIRTALTDHVIVQPRPGSDLQGLAEVVGRYRKCVIWLDELDLYLGTGGLTVDLVNRLLADQRGRRRIIVATMRAREYDRYSARNRDTAVVEGWRAGREVLHHSAVDLLELPRRWSAKDVQAARSSSHDPRIASALRQSDRFGLAEVLAAGPELYEQWQNGRDPTFHPRGAAIVSAAVDCRRMGLHRPVPIEALNDLYDLYLDGERTLGTRLEPLDEALEWATAVAYASSSLLIPHDSGYMAFDYLIDQRLPAIPEEAWHRLLKFVTPVEAYDIGWAAIDYLRPDLAMRAFAAARDHGVADAEYAYLNAMGNAGRSAEAADLLLTNAQGFEQELGRDDPRTVRAFRDYTRYLGESGRHEEAVRVLADMLPEDVRRSGPLDRSTLLTTRLLGRFLCESGDHDAGLAYLRRVSADCEEALGRRDVDSLQARLECARYTAKAGGPVEALTMLEALQDDLDSILGSDHPFSLSCRYEAARARGDSGDRAAAVRLLDDLVVDQRRILGRSHSRVLSTQYQRARFKGEQGDLDAAVAELAEVVAERRRISGDRHVRTLSARLQLAVFEGLRGAADADQEIEATRVACASTLGPRHPLTQRATVAADKPDERRGARPHGRAPR